VDLDVHLVERLLHPLDAAAALDHQVRDLPLQGTQLGDGLGRPERALKQPVAVELLQPLTILAVGLGAARDVVQLARVDEHGLDAARFEQLIEWDPVDGRALHRGGRDALPDEPVDELAQVRRGRAEHAKPGRASRL